jgi:ligand-binding sensor domain-containing protein
MKKIVLLILLLISSAYSFAQQEEWIVYDTLNSKISNNQIKTLAIDSIGNVWMVTGDCFYGGDVVKFNGNEFTVYDSASANLPDRFITCLAFDKVDKVWMGSRYHGISCFDGNLCKNFNSLNSAIPDNHIKYTTSDNDGNLWVCTDKGLAVFKDQQWKIFTVKNSALPSNNVNYIAFEKNSKAFWVATDKGVLNCYSVLSLMQVSDVASILYNKSNSKLPDDLVTQVVIDDSGNKWFSSWGGLVKYNENTWEVYTPENAGLPSFCEYVVTPEKEHLWIATNMGLFLFDKKVLKSYTPANSKIPSYFVNLVAIGNNGEKWIATQNGLVKLIVK